VSSAAETGALADPCTRPEDHATEAPAVTTPKNGAPEEVAAPTISDESAKAEAINLQRAIEASDLTAAAPAQSAPIASGAAPQAFEPDAGARALEQTGTPQQPAAAPVDPYQYSYPGTPAPQGAGVVRTRSTSPRFGTTPKQTPQYAPDTRDLGRLYRPYYSNGFINQFRNAW
jgi:hypothetical protein